MSNGAGKGAGKGQKRGYFMSSDGLKNGWVKDTKAETAGTDALGPGPESYDTEVPKLPRSVSEFLDESLREARRVNALLDAGYAPAVTLRHPDTVGRRNRRMAFWAQSSLTAEYESGIDEAPMPTRQTGRVFRYAADGLTVDTLSVAALKRHAAQHGDKPFQSAIAFVDEKTGTAGQTTVRVTKNPGGMWSVEPIGVADPQTSLRVRELLSARLEKRTWAHQPEQTGDLIEGCRERWRETNRRVGAELSPVDSDWIESMGYIAGAGVHVTKTKRGAIFGHEAPVEVSRKVRGARGAGTAWNQSIRGSKRVEISECPSCHRAYRSADPHTCAQNLEHKRLPLGSTDPNAASRRRAVARAASLDLFAQARAAREEALTASGPARRPFDF